MLQVLDAEFWARLLGIVIIDLTLAGDNALVIALAVRTLPPRERLWGRIWGTAGAVGLRLLFIALASLVLALPLVQLAGGLVLIWVALKLVRQDGESAHEVRQGNSLWQAVWIIIVADAVMSLDNVLAVAATAHGDLLLVAIGIGLTLPIVVWGSGLLAALMNRFPAIIWLGAGILGYVAGEMVLADPSLGGLVAGRGEVRVAAGAALGAAIAGFGAWRARQERLAGRRTRGDEEVAAPAATRHSSARRSR